MGEYDSKYYKFPMIEKDANYDWAMVIKDNNGVPMTGLTGASLELIVKYTEGGKVLQDLSSYLTLTPATARVVMAMTPAQTTAIKWTRGVYRLILTLASGATKVLLYGDIMAKGG